MSVMCGMVTPMGCNTGPSERAPMKHVLRIMIDEVEDFLTVAKKMNSTVLFRSRGGAGYHDLWFPTDAARGLTMFSCTALGRVCDAALESGDFLIIDAEWKYGE